MGRSRRSRRCARRRLRRQSRRLRRRSGSFRKHNRRQSDRRPRGRHLTSEERPKTGLGQSAPPTGGSTRLALPTPGDTPYKCRQCRSSLPHGHEHLAHRRKSAPSRLVPFFWPINCWLFGAIEAGQMIACVSNLRMAEIPKELSRMRRRPRRLRELDGTARNARRRLEVELFRPELRSVNLRLPPELLQQVDDERRVCDLWGHSVAVRAAQDDDRRGFGFSPGGSDAAAARQTGAVPDFARRLAGRISRAGLIPPIWPVMDTSTDVDVSRKVGNHALRHCLYACEHR